MNSILTLLQLKNVGRKTVIKSIKENSANKLLEKHRTEIAEALSKAEAIKELCRKNCIEFVTILDNSFPVYIKDIPDPPPILFCKGNISLLNSQKAVAIVGTRKPTDYGLEVAYRLSKIFTEKGFTIVSGLATGIDTAAHTSCLDAGGKTIAVMPCGLDKVYPAVNKVLAQRIIDSNGLLISEYAPGSAVQKSFFVERDRIQSGLSQGVIVVESTVGGGTMHTAGFAIKQKRKLGVVVPPDKYIDDEHFEGNRKLLQSGYAFPLKVK